MTRYPALVLSLAWSIALAATVVLGPGRAALGAAALAVALPIAALTLVTRPALVALAVSVALLGVARAELPAGEPGIPARAAQLAGITVAMSGRVADDSRPAGGGAEVLVEPTYMVAGATPITDVGNLIVRWRGPTTVTFGDEVAAAGRLMLPRDLPAFDRRAYLSQRGVYLELQASSFDVTRGAAGIGGLPGWIRRSYTSTVTNLLPAPHAAVLLGVVLGIREGMPASLQQALIATGLIHLLVLSGLKVAVFARIVQGALHPMLGRLAAWPAVVLIGLYATAGGATPAAIRASAMGVLAIIAANLGRPSHVWTSLAVTAAAMLAWRPEYAWDVGFQLSFAGTAAIILLTPAIAARVAFLPHFLREPFAVTCAAQLGTLPMMATDFHVVSPAAPIANALTLPILPALVAGGLMLGALAPAPDFIARAISLPVVGLLAYVEQVAYVLARLPAASIAIPAFPTWLGLAYYSALGPAIAGAHASGRNRKLALAVSCGAPLLISIGALAMWANAPPQAVVMNVGDGQAVLLRGPHGTILIDGGPSPARLNAELGLLLPPWQHRLDALVITAPGLGHVGGLAGFDRPARTVIIPEGEIVGSAWRTATLEEVARGAAMSRAGAGMTTQVAGFELEFFAPEPGAPGDQVGAADLGVRVVAPDGRSFCDASDLDLDAQTVAAARVRGTCSYVLLPSGGRSRLSPDFERATVTATTQLVASRSTGRLAAGYPPNVERTDQEGTITLPL